MRIEARTRVFALLGDPVRHSLSPVIQNAAFRAAGVDAVYVALPCTPAEVAPLMAALVRTGGGGNITVPHKQVAAGVGAPDARVAAIGAANVFGAGSDGGMVVRNTDVDGILALVERLGVPADAWLVAGTGGSARAVVAAAREAGAAIAVQSRDSARAAAFAAWAATLGVAAAPPAEATLAINATPLGLHADDARPLDVDALPALRGVLDLTYRADGATALVAEARAKGLAAEDGREMLLVQGAAAWATWLPGTVPSLSVMRAALAGWMG